VSGEPGADAAPGAPPNPEPGSAGSPSAGRPVELFTIPFASGMSDRDLSVLTRAADLTTRGASATSPREQRVGPARLDHHSGLFLAAGADEGHWLLQARTWGRPSSESVHRWNVMAAGAARRLDPTVAIPDRRADTSLPLSDTHVGSVSNKRFAAFRRRLVGGS
jgi:hypothetical protein